MTEYRFDNEDEAHAHRAEFIAQGGDVSLIAFDGERSVFVFDAKGPVSFWTGVARSERNAAYADSLLANRHPGHVNQFGLWYCDTCKSADCELSS